MSDLLIGGSRRSRAHSTLRVLAVAALALVVGGLVVWVVFRRVTTYAVPDGELPRATLAATPDGALSFGDASLRHVGGLAVLRVRGDAHRIGAAHGWLAGAAAPPFDTAIGRTVGRGGWTGDLTHASRLRWRYRLLDDGIPGHHLVEAAGLQRGADASGEAPGYQALVRRLAALDLGVAAPRSPDTAVAALTETLTFAATLRGAAGDRLLVGRSFGLPGLDDGGQGAAAALTVTFVHADGAIPFASVGWPGLTGVVSGINAEGIAVMLHPALAADVRVTRRAQPAALLARDVLENARSLEDAVAILEQARPLGAAAFFVADGDTRRWAVIERSPERTAVRTGTGDPVVTDVLEGEAFAEDPDNDRARRLRPAAGRAARVRELLALAPLAAPEQVAAVLRDRRGPGGAPRPLGHRGALDPLGAAHTAVFDASGLVLWVADGGAGGRFRGFDLRHELRGEGARPAPPADLAAEADLDPAAVAAVLAARSDLRAARRAQAAGSRQRARELAARALAWAPELPAAHRVAGDLARAAGDEAGMRTHYLRYLELGADDPGAEAEIRALLQ